MRNLFGKSRKLEKKRINEPFKKRGGPVEKDGVMAGGKSKSWAPGGKTPPEV